MHNTDVGEVAAYVRGARLFFHCICNVVLLLISIPEDKYLN
jgi:hypothetical protein